MALIVNRAYWDNQVLKTPTVITGSSAQVTFPAERVRDDRRSKTWRSAIGWNIVLGVNDVIDFTEGTSGAAQASITPGNYPTGNLLAAEATTELNLAASDNTYLVTYDAGTDLFTIARATGADTFDLNWATGPGSSFSIGPDMGYDVVDDTGATSYIGDVGVVKSAEWVAFDFLAAVAIDAAIVLEANQGSAGTIKVQGDAAGTFLAPGFEATLVNGDTFDDAKLLDFFASSETFRYWRILIEDRMNAAGFSQLGQVFLGPKTEFTTCYKVDTREPIRQLTEIGQADQGAIFADVKPARREWNLGFVQMEQPDKDLWDELVNDRKIGKHLYFAFDAANFPVIETVYGYFRSPGVAWIRHFSDGTPSAPPVVRWSATVPFSEAIG